MGTCEQVAYGGGLSGGEGRKQDKAAGSVPAWPQPEPTASPGVCTTPHGCARQAISQAFCNCVRGLLTGSHEVKRL